MITTEKQLDEIDKKIILRSKEGLTAKEIAYEIKLTPRAVEARIREMKSWYRCKTMAQLIHKLRLNV